MTEPPWKTTVKKYHNELRTNILIANVLPALHPVLTDAEYIRVDEKECRIDSIDELVRILLTKDHTTFAGFCSALEANGYPHWASKLRENSEENCSGNCVYLTRVHMNRLAVYCSFLRFRRKPFVTQYHQALDDDEERTGKCPPLVEIAHLTPLMELSFDLRVFVHGQQPYLPVRVIWPICSRCPPTIALCIVIARYTVVHSEADAIAYMK